MNVKTLSKFLMIWLSVTSLLLLSTLPIALIMNPELSIILIIGAISIFVIPAVLSILLYREIKKLFK